MDSGGAQFTVKDIEIEDKFGPGRSTRSRNRSESADETQTDADAPSDNSSQEGANPPVKASSSSGVAVVSTTPNVVVERVGGGMVTWNLTAAATVTGGEADGESKEGAGGVFPLDLGGSSTILTQEQILKIDAALKSEQMKETNPLLQDLPHPGHPGGSLDGMGPAVPAEGPETEEKMNTSHDSINFDAVLDIGPSSFNTKDLMNQVMSSELLMEAIGDEGLVTAATVVDASAAGSDGADSETGSTSDSTGKKDDSSKRRSARIAHITANDLTLRQTLREKEQKKKEREERKRQKEEEKKAAKDAMDEGTPQASPQEEEVEEQSAGTDLNSEIAKYLQVIDLEIKKSESPGEAAADEGEMVKAEKQDEKKSSPSLFEKLAKTLKKKTVKEDSKKGQDEKDIEKGSKMVAKKEKIQDKGEEKELGEVEDEEKEVGEISDQDEPHPDSNTSVYWMDHSYAASSTLPTPERTSGTGKQSTETTPRRSSRRESRKNKETDEDGEEKKDEKARRSHRGSKAEKEESVEKDSKNDKKSKSGKHRRRDRTSGKEEEDKQRERSHSRSQSKERSGSKEKDRHRKGSKSIETEKEETDKKKRRHKEKEKEKEKKDKDKEKEKEKKKGDSGKKSSRRSREIKKPKHDDDELSDIPFSSEEEVEEERDDGEQDFGSDWTSDDDPEKLWCICRQPHDGKFMICCDKCEDWFHGKCVSVSKKEGKRMEQENLSWMCPKCTDEVKTAKSADEKSKTKRETESLKEEAAVKDKDRSKKKGDKKKEETTAMEKSEKKDKEKAVDEKRRKRKSISEPTKTGKEEKSGEEGEAPSKKKRLKFFRPPPPKQHCIGPRCENWARAGSVYCSPGCIVRHAKESMRLLSAEKERTVTAAGVKARRDSAGGSSASTTPPPLKLREDERISVIERHTGRLRTGLTAPTYEELPYWLGRHPTYEVLRPNIKHGYTTSSPSFGGRGASKHKSEARRTSLEGDNATRSHSMSSHHPTSPKDTEAESLERRQRERREKVRQLLDMKRREDEVRERELRERELERKTVEEMRRKREEERREEEERKKREEEKRKKEEKERREREKREKEERLKQQAESSKLAEQTSESVRVNVKRTLLDVLLNRVKRAPDMKAVAADEVKRVAKQIEFELYKLFNDTGAKYKAKYRTLIFNIKDMKNKGLFRHILKGEISPKNLVRMSSDQLASKELMKWREQEAKNELDMIVQTEQEKKSLSMHFVKKTHKGEVELAEGNVLGDSVPHTDEDPESTKREGSQSPLDSSLLSPTRAPPFSSPTSSSSTSALHAGGGAGGTSPPTPTSPTTPTTMLLDTTDQHKAHLFDLNCKICTGKIRAPQEEKASKKAVVRKTPKVSRKITPVDSGTDGGAIRERPVKFFGEEVEEKKSRPKSIPDELYDDLMETVAGVEDDDDDDDDVHIDAEEGSKDLSRRKRDDGSRTPPGKPPNTVTFHHKATVEKAPRPSGVKRSSSSTATTSSPDWRGFIFMPEVSKFVAVAHHVSGPANTIPLDLQDTLEVCGRIPYPVVWDYFTKLKQSQSTEMTVVRFHVWQPDEEAAYFALFDYFYTRQRIGVIGKNRPHVKDFYVVALPSGDKVPSQILPFHGPGLPKNRPHMLIGIIVRHKDKQRSLSLDSDAPPKTAGHHHHEATPSREAAKKKAPPPAHDILPPVDTLSSFRSALPNMREMSDIVDSKMPLRTRDVYVPDSQVVDPIVAQYANAAPEELEVELEEPYSPSREEREAPYDPSDPTDDWNQGRRMPASAIIPEPADPTIPPPAAMEKDPTELKAAADIASVAADASQDILSAFSEQGELSEQQQLLIQLTKQVEEAKKALLDRQIESLQTEINKATGKLTTAPTPGPGDQPSGDDAGTSPDVRLALADSSTMTPKDEVSNTPVSGGGDTPKNVPPLQPPPGLPPFALSAVMWNLNQEGAGVEKGSPSSAAAQPGMGDAAGTLDATPTHPGHAPHQPPQHPADIHRGAGTHRPDAMGHHPESSHPYAPPIPPHEPHNQYPSTHSHPHHAPSHPHPHHQSSPPSFPPNPPRRGHNRPHHHRNHPRHDPPGPHSRPYKPRDPAPPLPLPPMVHATPPRLSTPLLDPSPTPSPTIKKRKLEPPPPGVEGWKYGDDNDDDHHAEPRDVGPPKKAALGGSLADPPPPGHGSFNPRTDWEGGPRKDMDLRRPDRGRGSEDVDLRQPWGRGRGRERQEPSWERDNYGHPPPHHHHPHQHPHPHPHPHHQEDWEQGGVRDYQHRVPRQPLLDDLSSKPSGGFSRDYGHRAAPR